MIGQKNNHQQHLRFRYIPRYHDEQKEELDVRKGEIARQVKEGRTVKTTKRQTFELKNKAKERKKVSFLKPIIFGAALLMMLYALELLIAYYM